MKQATQWECPTPELGWEKFSLALGRRFLEIQQQGPEWATIQGFVLDDAKRADHVFRVWARLVGELYLVIDQMERHEHECAAEAMHELLDLVVELDVLDRNVRIEINKRFEAACPYPRLRSAGH